MRRAMGEGAGIPDPAELGVDDVDYIPQDRSCFVFPHDPAAATGPARFLAKLRQGCIWLIRPTTRPAAYFGNVILLLIVVNCSLLAIQTPVAGPSVKCVLPGPNEPHDKSKHNCEPETYAGAVGDQRCEICQVEGECSCEGPLAPGFTNANFAEEAELFFTVAFTIEALIRIIARGFVMHKGAYLRCASGLLASAAVPNVLSPPMLVATELTACG